jgi:putative transposase
MARHLRLEYEGAIYHVTVRSNSGGKLYEDDRDRDYWLYRLGESVQLHGVRLYAYCMMDNHFHLLVETPQANLGRFMQGVLTGYSVFFNRRHRRHGHVTQGRYGARLVAGDAYLRKLTRYVHLNPVKIKRERAKPLEERLKRLREYPWSSYRLYVGVAPRPEWLDVEPMLALAGGRGKDRLRRYAEFVEAGVAEDDAEFQGELMRSARCIGDDRFRAEVDSRYAAAVRGARRPEDAALRVPQGPRLAAEVVLHAVAEAAGVAAGELRQRRRGTGVKSVAGWLLGRYAGLTQRDAAPLLGLTSGVSLCYHVRRLPSLAAADPAVKRLLERAEATIRREMERKRG